MIAKDRGRGLWLFSFVLAVVVIGDGLPVSSTTEYHIKASSASAYT